uniref:aldehyde oxygenase (deformylating) n=1 Tax=Oryza meridionalis TaxID=40149 RepID=A0A0E0EC11_9ORYZ
MHRQTAQVEARWTCSRARQSKAKAREERRGEERRGARARRTRRTARNHSFSPPPFLTPPLTFIHFSLLPRPRSPRRLVLFRSGEPNGGGLTGSFTEFQLATVVTFLLHETVFFLSGLPSLLFERFGLFAKYKIQKKSNTPSYQNRCVLRLILYHVCVNLPVMVLSYPAFKFMGLRSSLPLPHWTVIVSQVLFYFVLEDFIFYWGHRALHTKWLYKHVHSVHHEYATPFGLTSEYAHPAEILFLGFATIVGPALTGPHLFTLWLWMVLRVLETVEAHSGYHFPWSPSNFLPLYGGSDFHDYHHRVLYTKSGNYASTFVYMDWLFGTDKDYRNAKAIEEKDGKHFMLAADDDDFARAGG